MAKLKIAIISNDDKVFSLYAWNNVFESKIFTDEYDCVGLWTCNQKFKKEKGFYYWIWYLRTFGSWNFFKLFSFVISFKFFSYLKFFIGNYHLSFRKLSKANQVDFRETSTPNSPDFIEWVKANKIDILIIMVDYILKPEILAIPKICVLNKHASLLPENKGLFPFFWAAIAGQTQGVTFHKVNEKIDEGDLYYQERMTKKQQLNSMISFYFYVHRYYHRMLNEALKNITMGTIIPSDPNLVPGYNGFPAAENYLTFKKKGGKIITLSEILLPSVMLKKQVSL